MGILKRTKKSARPGAVTVPRTAVPKTGGLARHLPCGAPQYRLYDAIRDSIPMVDAAIEKTVRLIGGFRVKCGDRAAERSLSDFLATVKTGCCGNGIRSFIATYLDALLTYGTAVAEMVFDTRGSLAALYNADVRELELFTDENPLKLHIADQSGREIEHPERLLVSAVNTPPGQALGRSLLCGLPFVSGILLQIFESIGNNWERAGNLRFAVTYRPENDFDSAFAGDRAAEIAREWSAAMSDDGQIRDFVSVGDVDIKVIGADNQVLDSSVPVRQICEQIIAKTGIPPFMLGVSWSTTERMASQQADLLTTELEYYRSVLEPVIIRICETYLAHEGFLCDLSIIWDDISLQDEVELAKARLLRAQAAQIEEKLGGKDK